MMNLLMSKYCFIATYNINKLFKNRIFKGSLFCISIQNIKKFNTRAARLEMQYLKLYPKLYFDPYFNLNKHFYFLSLVTTYNTSKHFYRRRPMMEKFPYAKRMVVKLIDDRVFLSMQNLDAKHTFFNKYRNVKISNYSTALKKIVYTKILNLRKIFFKKPIYIKKLFLHYKVLQWTTRDTHTTLAYKNINSILYNLRYFKLRDYFITNLDDFFIQNDFFYQIIYNFNFNMQPITYTGTYFGEYYKFNNFIEFPIYQHVQILSDFTAENVKNFNIFFDVLLLNFSMYNNYTFYKHFPLATYFDDKTYTFSIEQISDYIDVWVLYKKAINSFIHDILAIFQNSLSAEFNDPEHPDMLAFEELVNTVVDWSTVPGAYTTLKHFENHMLDFDAIIRLKNLQLIRLLNLKAILSKYSAKKLNKYDYIQSFQFKNEDAINPNKIKQLSQKKFFLNELDSYFEEHCVRITAALNIIFQAQVDHELNYISCSCTQCINTYNSYQSYKTILDFKTWVLFRWYRPVVGRWSSKPLTEVRFLLSSSMITHSLKKNFYKTNVKNIFELYDDTSVMITTRTTSSVYFFSNLVFLKKLLYSDGILFKYVNNKACYDLSTQRIIFIDPACYLSTFRFMHKYALVSYKLFNAGNYLNSVQSEILK